MSIPISQIVQVNPGVLAAAGSAVDLNGVILTQNAYAPTNSVLTLASADDAGAYFGPTSIEKKMADVYFGGFENATKKPGSLLFYRYATTAVAAFLRGGKLGLTLIQLKALTGDLSVTIDGIIQAAGTLNFSAVTSFSEAATVLANSLSADVVYDSLHEAFIVTSLTTGDASTIAEATGTLAAVLRLTVATGAVVSQGVGVQAEAETMDALKAKTLNWATFSTAVEVDLAAKKAFADWSNAQNDRFAYVAHDSDVNAKTTGSTTTFGAYLKATNTSGVIPFFGTELHAAFVQGFAAALDFTRLNGRQTLAFRQQSGLPASVTDGSEAAALEANGYNFYGAYANAKEDFIFAYPGSTPGKWKWVDSYLNQVWLNANLQGAMIRLLLNVGSIPYNVDGYALIEAACTDPLTAGVNFGAIRAGVTLSAAQKAEIKFALGFDASSSIFAKGYYLQIAEASAATRTDRTSPPMTLYYTDGGSIHRLTLASIEVQ